MKIRLPVLLLCCLAATAVLGDTLYKWVDAQGNVHYSDKPQPGAQKLTLPQVTTFTAPSAADLPASAPEETKPREAGFTRFEIVSPQQDETFWNVQEVTVALAVEPQFGDGDTVTITLDAQSQGPLTNLTATFGNLDRGQHTIDAVLHGANGVTMTAKEVTFYIQRGTQH